MRKLVCFLFRFLFTSAIYFLISIGTINAQSSSTDYKNDPVWIQMMENPHVNYYEAVKAYEMYWENHKKPANEEEEMAEGKENFKEREREIKKEVKKDKDRVRTVDEIKKKNDDDLMIYQIKRFEQWKREVFPFVQEDGRILSDKERMEIWNKQQEEIRNQKK